MPAMDRLRQFTCTLFRVTVCVFVFNSAAAYGACCTVSAPIEPSDIATDVPPCHTPSDADVELQPSGECCESCVPAYLSIVQVSDLFVMASMPDVDVNSRPRSFIVSPPVQPPD